MAPADVEEAWVEELLEGELAAEDVADLDAAEANILGLRDDPLLRAAALEDPLGVHADGLEDGPARGPSHKLVVDLDAEGHPALVRWLYQVDAGVEGVSADGQCTAEELLHPVAELLADLVEVALDVEAASQVHRQVHLLEVRQLSRLILARWERAGIVLLLLLLVLTEEGAESTE